MMGKTNLKNQNDAWVISNYTDYIEEIQNGDMYVVNQDERKKKINRWTNFLSKSKESTPNFASNIERM